MTDQWTERLSEYLDGDLADPARAELERHLSGCAVCRDTLTELREVTARAAALPPRPPARDLWPGVAARIAPGTRSVRPIGSARRRFSFSLPQLAAAAVLLMMLSGGAAWLLRGPAVPAPSGPMATRPLPAGREPTVRNAAHAVPDRSSPSYAAAVQELEEVLAEERARLDPATVRVLEENLAVINQAVSQAQAALATDPQNAYLSTHLAQTMQQKLSLLRRAAALASRS